MPPDASARLLDDLRTLVERHGADEIHLTLERGEWTCAWGRGQARRGSALDADLAAAVRAIRTQADAAQRSLGGLIARQAVRKGTTDAR